MDEKWRKNIYLTDIKARRVFRRRAFYTVSNEVLYDPKNRYFAKEKN